eukprot:Gb_20863 [translate_table: standard]
MVEETAMDVDQTAAQIAGLRGRNPNSNPNANGLRRRVCFSFAAYARSVIDHLKRCQVPIARGLTDQEFGAIQATFGFTFPPDLRSILQEGLPVGVGFPNWRSGATQQLQMMLDLPMAGLSYDIAKGKFWWKEWGPQPLTSREALHIARHEFSKAPILVPIYSHCYIPCSPCLAGNPVFFVYQNDFYYCGYDVADFFQREAFVPHNFNNGGNSQQQQQQLLEPRASVIRELIDTQFESPRLHSTIKTLTTNCSPRTGTTRVDSASAAVISSYNYFHRKPLSANVLTRFTIQAPSWAAKTARKVHFWSDLVEQKDKMNTASPNGVFSSIKVEIDFAKAGPRCKKVRWEDLAMTADTENIDVSRKWVANFLKDVVQSRLRNGGWKDEDISDIVNSSSSSSTANSSLQLTKNGLEGQNLMENLALRFDVLSGSLRKGGWSAKDIVECFNLDSNSCYSKNTIDSVAKFVAEG